MILQNVFFYAFWRNELFVKLFKNICISIEWVVVVDVFLIFYFFFFLYHSLDVYSNFCSTLSLEWHEKIQIYSSTQAILSHQISLTCVNNTLLFSTTVNLLLQPVFIRCKTQFITLTSRCLCPIRTNK